MQLIVSFGFLLIDVCRASDHHENFHYIAWIQLTLQIRRIAETVTKNYYLVMNVPFSIAIRDLQGNSERVIVRLTKEHIREGWNWFNKKNCSRRPEEPFSSKFSSPLPSPPLPSDPDCWVRTTGSQKDSHLFYFIFFIFILLFFFQSWRPKESKTHCLQKPGEQRQS